MKALIDPKSPKADRLEDQAILPTPIVVPLESSMRPPHEDLKYERWTPLPADSDVEPEQPSEPVFPDLVLTPKGKSFQMVFTGMATGLFATKKFQTTGRHRFKVAANAWMK